MENIIDQEQIDKVVELNEKLTNLSEPLKEALEKASKLIPELKILKKEIGVKEEDIDWEEKYYDTVELLTIRENRIKDQHSIIQQSFEQNKWRESEIRRQEIVIQAYRKDNEALRKRLKDKYWRLFEKIAPYFILLIFSLGLMFHLI